MNKKDELINNIIVAMENQLSMEQLNFLTYQLSKELSNLNVSDISNLPSLDLCNNNEVIKRFIIFKKIEGLSENTLKAYLYTLTTTFTLIDKNIVDVDSNDIRLYLLECARKMQNVTVDNVRRNLNSFFSWCTTEDFIAKNPMDKIKKIKAEKKIKPPHTTVEVQKVKDACKTDRDIAYIDFLCSTGVRCEEITKVKLSDIDFESRSVLIHGKGAKQRYVYLDDVANLHIIKYLKDRALTSEYLFCNRTGGMLSKEGASFIVRSLGRIAGVKNCQIHRFRKWFATTLFNRGCDLVYIQKLLGHAKLETTMIYVQASTDRTKQEFAKFIA